MNSFMIKKLVAKDWYFFRYILFAYLAGGAIALGIMFSGGGSMFTIGAILLVTAIISLGCHLVMGTVVQERKMQTLTFIMSLPVSIKDYTLAKMTATISVFLVLWLTLSISLLAVMSTSETGGGAVPLFTLMLVWMLITYLIMLGTALVSESENWTIVAMAVCNTAFTLVFMGLNAIEGIGGPLLEQPEVIWTTASLSMLGLEVAVIALIVGMTFYFQSRKSDFL